MNVIGPLAPNGPISFTASPQTPTPEMISIHLSGIQELPNLGTESCREVAGWDLWTESFEPTSLSLHSPMLCKL